MSEGSDKPQNNQSRACFPDFAIYGRNWLCIYTSSPRPALKFANGAKFSELPTPDRGQRHFDTVSY
jgi:hypothetical protein